MRIESVTLRNVGHFQKQELHIPLAPIEDNKPKVTVFIGNNGSGKTTILKSLATALSWFPARIRSERARGADIPEEVISRGESSAAITLNVWGEQGDIYKWTLSKVKVGRKNQFTTDLRAVNELADIYRTSLTTNELTNLPLIVFYPVERSVLDIPLKIRTKHSFEQLNAYDNALSFDVGLDFRRFFEWFREQEDIENEERTRQEINDEFQDIQSQSELLDKVLDLSVELEDLIGGLEGAGGKSEELPYILKAATKKRAEIEQVRQSMNLFLNSSKKNNSYFHLQLQAVRDAIKCFTDFDNIRVQRKPKLRMIVQKDGKDFSIFQLSQGEKSLMALVGDIARRLAMLNPELVNPLQGQGIVILDEADLHLHPQWQRKLIERLIRTFPNCQFIMSTHSPLVISDSKDIVVYSLENGEMHKIPSLYGQDANTVLIDVMDTAIRNPHVGDELNALLDLIQDSRLGEAKASLAKLKDELPKNHLELIKAELYLKKQEMRHEKNK